MRWLDPTNSAQPYTLEESVRIDPGGQLFADGQVYLDVVSGAWQSIYNTNTYLVPDSADLDNNGGFADITFNFSLQDSNVQEWILSGNPTAQGNFNQPIPEPATMLLLGTGLVGVAGAARRKKKNQA